MSLRPLCLHSVGEPVSLYPGGTIPKCVVQGDFEPVVTNEQEVARSFLQPVKVVLEGVIALEDFAKVSGGSVEMFNNASKPV